MEDMLKDVKVNPDVFKFDPEEEEEILERAGSKDLIELMVCKNCLSCITKKGKLWCSEKDSKTQPDNACSFWSEKLKGNELKETYEMIVNILKEFIDTTEDNYCIISLWIIGTYFHKEFETYPYLFINAMRGSGKTRLLKLIECLSRKGDLQASLTDAVLFRTTGTLLLDEFESIGSKEKNSLRELLNTAYKKGGKVKRMRKAKGLDGESQVVEEFHTFRPIVMANISGMEEVLADRCISIVLEKSAKKKITKKIENFTSNKKIARTTLNLQGLVSFVSVSFVKKNTYQDWNDFIDKTINYTNYTTTLTTLNDTKQHQLFKKIDETEIDGRNLELTFSLILIAEEIGIVDYFIEIIKKVISSRKEEDRMEGRDVMVYSFVSKQTPNEWYKVKELTNMFRQEVDYDEKENWLNYYWFGKALKRLNLVLNKKRIGSGREVILDIKKAKEKMMIFN